MKTFLSIVAFFLTLVLAGCASILSDSSYPVSIKSNVEGATVTVKNDNGNIVHKSTTPTQVTLNATDGYFNAASYSVAFEKEGYLPSTTPAQAQLDGWYIGNLIFGGLIGWLIVDPATGAMWRLEEGVYGNLAKDPDFRPPEALSEADDADTSTSSEIATDAEGDSAPEEADKNEVAEDTGAETAEAESDDKAPLDLRTARERLEELKAMKEQGLLTEKEYEEKRKETVEQM